MKKAIVTVPYLSGNGGTETVIKNFYDAVVKDSQESNLDWKLISFGGTKYSRWMKKWPKKVYRFSNKRVIQLICYVLIMPFLIQRLLKKEHPDFFIATNPIIWTLAFKFKKKISPDTQIIAWYHYSFKMKKVKRKYLNCADKFWAISSGIREELLSMGISDSKIFVIYNPVPINNIDLIPRSHNQNHFIYIGRIDYSGQKNVSELIRALNGLKGNWTCNLYGKVDEHTQDKLLKEANNTTRSNIRFKGFYKDVWSHIDKADALILTSKFEGLPMVLIEAIARGVAVISSDCPTGTKDIVNKNNGWLYRMGKEKQLTHILNGLIFGERRLPNPINIQKSAQVFNYNNYRHRILKSLN
ncbi:MAG: glycosyltransferase [Clostridium sp.]|jgi:UDP-D-galactose:(glucosyl)LPS alpha-1,6-D-galactosyltransferase|uniref:glycosyltransferase n=1 Tax=Clostridium sp. TaxID=1506 RepID=UPI002A758E69|nr:glycosyltransferase [Clostridium sp.]MDY2630918.1 glycosyltransferase [Clostridium sp.]MDY2787488.1 glycosyltransferase [Lactobacillus amylovorus]